MGRGLQLALQAQVAFGHAGPSELPFAMLDLLNVASVTQTLWRAFLRSLRLARLRVSASAAGADVQVVPDLAPPTLGGALGNVCLENRLATRVAGVERDAVRHPSIRDTKAHAHSTATIAPATRRVNVDGIPSKRVGVR